MEAGFLPDRLFVKIRDLDPERGFDFQHKVYRGDRVVFTRNESRLGVENGALGTVIAMRPLIGNIAVQLDSGKTVYLYCPKCKAKAVHYAGYAWQCRPCELTFRGPFKKNSVSRKIKRQLGA